MKLYFIIAETHYGFYYLKIVQKKYYKLGLIFFVLDILEMFPNM